MPTAIWMLKMSIFSRLAFGIVLRTNPTASMPITSKASSQCSDTRSG
jgi:hypothetical protein